MNNRHWFKRQPKKPESILLEFMNTDFILPTHNVLPISKKFTCCVFRCFFYCSTVNINYLILHESNCNHTISCIDLLSAVVINRIQIRHITGIMCNDIPKLIYQHTQTNAIKHAVKITHGDWTVHTQRHLHIHLHTNTHKWLRRNFGASHMGFDFVEWEYNVFMYLLFNRILSKNYYMVLDKIYSKNTRMKSFRRSLVHFGK